MKKIYYCLGIKGTGMSTLAQILFDLGNDVVGYDDAKATKFTEEGLKERNIKIFYEANTELDKNAIVTFSRALGDNHKEVKRLREEGYTIKSYAEIMGEVISLFKSIGCSGTHGKTTTSSLVKHILEKTIKTSYFIGAGDGKVTDESDYFVVESDEYNKHFTHYHPKYSIITNIEEEHMECYDDLNDIINTFEIFANQTSDLVVANGDNENVRKINYKTNVKFYGFNSSNDIVISNVASTEEFTTFNISVEKNDLGEFQLPLHGNHMVMNAAAAIYLTNKIGISTDDIKSALKTFKNAKRRFVVEKVGTNIIVDDYAHHPTEIKVTIDSAKQKYPNKKIIAVFKPNTYSRTKDFKDKFIECFKEADYTYLTLVESNRETQEQYPNINSNNITDELTNGELISVDSIDKLKQYENSVICFMSCAYIDDLINGYKELFK